MTDAATTRTSAPSSVSTSNPADGAPTEEMSQI
jgi:hypothetical protein